MKIKDLIKKLQTMDPELEIFHQTDAEGNGYLPLGGADEGFYLEGDVYKLEEDKEWLEEAEYDLSFGKKCAVIYPAW